MGQTGGKLLWVPPVLSTLKAQVEPMGLSPWVLGLVTL